MANPSIPGGRGAVHAHARNPRRAYDADGREITPMTLQNAMDRGVTALRAICACGHEAEVSIHVGRWASTSFVPDAGMTLRCDDCGTPDPKTRPVWPRQGHRP